MAIKTPSRLIRRFLLHAVVLLVLVSWVLPASPPTATAAQPGYTVPPGHSDRIVRVKLWDWEDADLETLLGSDVSTDWSNIYQKITPLFSLNKLKLQALKRRGELRVPQLPDLSRWYEVRLRNGAKAERVIPLFAALPFVEIVGPAPLLTEPPATGDFTSLQGYLGPATGGIDAQYAWSLGATGAGITIYDIEYGWNREHEDLDKALGAKVLMDPSDSPLFSSVDHGTAVLGEMIASNNGLGVTGIAYGAGIVLAPANTVNRGWNPANAILLAAADGRPGDVILIEQQTYVCNLNSLGPSEAETAVYQAIQTATALGLVVVEAAGNGSVNLDQAACGATFNRSSRDSGAILVGAGRPPSSGYDRQRESISCYGNRVDVQAWGSGVMTTGYGTYYMSWDDYNSDYTATFSGTSSASPMVAAAAAVIQGRALQQNGAPLSPWQVRDLLVQTGSPQQGNTGEHIGPRPNLQAAITNLPQSDTTLIVSGGGDEGVYSLGEAISVANLDPATNFIELAAGATYTLGAVDNTDPTYGANGLPVITSPVTINAHGAVIEHSSAAGAEFRLFQVANTGVLTLNEATLRNSTFATGAGAAILNLGTATINDSTITGNSAADGGAIANQGTLTLISTTLANNSATASGGGIKNGGMLMVLGSTLAGNSAPIGGNLSTSGTATLKNTILVKGASGANCAGTPATGSIANLADDASCGTATVKTATEINLGPLAANEGPTQTMALLSPSAAIDAGNTTACLLAGLDQRGYSRFFDGNVDGIARCDIGAYEYGAGPPPPPENPDVTPPTTSVLLTPAAPYGWYGSTSTVKVESWDDESVVIEVRCALDPASPPAAYTDLPEDTCAFVAGAPVTVDGPHTLYAAAMNWYGRQSAPISVTFQIDVTPPIITCPMAGPFLLHSGEHIVGPASVDASLSGLDEAASTLSGTVTTESVGPRPLTFTAFDLAGNQAVRECIYRVIFDFDGFYQGVLPAPALTPVSAGSAVPLKFSLAGDQGINVIAADYPVSQAVDCTNLMATGPLEPTRLTNKGSLSYDRGNGWYNYEWKTQKAWGGTCRVLTIRLVDDTEHQAYFRFQ